MLCHLPYDNHSSYDICSPYMLCLFSHFECFRYEELIAVVNRHGITFMNDLPLEKKIAQQYLNMSSCSDVFPI